MAIEFLSICAVNRLRLSIKIPEFKGRYFIQKIYSAIY
jgi:hypothetical protein